MMVLGSHTESVRTVEVDRAVALPLSEPANKHASHMSMAAVAITAAGAPEVGSMSRALSDFSGVSVGGSASWITGTWPAGCLPWAPTDGFSRAAAGDGGMSPF